MKYTDKIKKYVPPLKLNFCLKQFEDKIIKPNKH